VTTEPVENVFASILLNQTFAAAVGTSTSAAASVAAKAGSRLDGITLSTPLGRPRFPRLQCGFNGAQD